MKKMLIFVVGFFLIYAPLSASSGDVRDDSMRIALPSPKQELQNKKISDVSSWRVNCNGIPVILSRSQSDLKDERIVFIEAFSEAYKNIPLTILKIESVAKFLNSTFTEEEEADIAKKDPKTLFISAKSLDGKVVGYVSFDADLDHIYIRQLAVKPELWRNGIGKALVFSVLKVFTNGRCLKAVCRRVNLIAKNFYRKYNFIEDPIFVHPGLSIEKYVGYGITLNDAAVGELLKDYEDLNETADNKFKTAGEKVENCTETTKRQDTELDQKLDSLLQSKVLMVPIMSPEVMGIEINDCGEELIDLKRLKNERIIPLSDLDPRCGAEYNENGKVRKTLYEHLLLMLQHLPEDLGIAFYEGYRPLSMQKVYFLNKFRELAENKKFDKVEDAYVYLSSIYTESCKLVSSVFDNVPVHCTGAAIDMTLFKLNADGSKKLLDLGKFGVMFGPNDQASTYAKNLSIEQKENRIIFFSAATIAGLINYGWEWWHWSYGDRAWALVEKKPYAIYGLPFAGDRNHRICSKEDFLQAAVNDFIKKPSLEV